jgi:recombinational DNA repair protein (RecF pathway)
MTSIANIEKKWKQAKESMLAILNPLRFRYKRNPDIKIKKVNRLSIINSFNSFRKICALPQKHWI